MPVLVLFVQPFVQAVGILQLAGNLLVRLRYRTRLPSPETYENDLDYRLPVDGEWVAYNGSPDPEYAHSWGIYS